MSRGFWTYKDLKEAHQTYETIEAADPNNPAKHFYMGMTMQMAGQTESADEHYENFCKRCIEFFGSILQAVEFHEKRLQDLKAQGQTTFDDREAYNVQEMIHILRDHNKARRRRRGCSLM